MKNQRYLSGTRFYANIISFRCSRRAGRTMVGTLESGRSARLVLVVGRGGVWGF